MKELSDLMSPGSHLSDVPPDFRGVSLARFKLLQATAQAREWDRRFRNEQPNYQPPLSGKRVWTPRDSYGMKGMP